MILDSGKCFWILGCGFVFWEVFWILGSVLDSGKCFWILGSVLECGKCFVLMSHRRNCTTQKKTSELKMASSKRSVTVVFAAMFLIRGALSQSSEYTIY